MKTTYCFLRVCFIAYVFSAKSAFSQKSPPISDLEPTKQDNSPKIFIQDEKGETHLVEPSDPRVDPKGSYRWANKPVVFEFVKNSEGVMERTQIPYVIVMLRDDKTFEEELDKFLVAKDPFKKLNEELRSRSKQERIHLIWGLAASEIKIDAVEIAVPESLYIKHKQHCDDIVDVMKDYCVNRKEKISVDAVFNAAEFLLQDFREAIPNLRGNLGIVVSVGAKKLFASGRIENWARVNVQLWPNKRDFYERQVASWLDGAAMPPYFLGQYVTVGEQLSRQDDLAFLKNQREKHIPLAPPKLGSQSSSELQEALDFKVDFSRKIPIYHFEMYQGFTIDINPMRSSEGYSILSQRLANARIDESTVVRIIADYVQSILEKATQNGMKLEANFSVSKAVSIPGTTDEELYILGGSVKTFPIR